MEITLKDVSPGEKELFIKIPFADLEPYLKEAAKQVSQEKKIPGFRPGKAPYNIVKQQVGEAYLLEKALGKIVQDTYLQALAEKKLDVFGQPEIEVLKIAPQNDLEYKAKVTLVPSVKLGNWKEIKVEKKEPKVLPHKVDALLRDLAESRAQEKEVERPAEKKDVVVVDLKLSQKGVVLDGGEAKDHKIILGEPYYIPGLEKELIGLKKGEEKNFSLTFPEKHFQKNLAGKKVDCFVKVKKVLERQVPAIDDNFARSLGNFKNLEDLKKVLQENLFLEAKQKEDERQEIEMLDKLLAISEFSALPEKLIKAEAQKMVSELEGNLANQGASFENYLSHLKKTREDLEKEFYPQAEKRVKTALLLRQFIQDEKIEVPEEEVEAEKEKILKQAPAGNLEWERQVNSEEYKNYLRNILLNRKAIKKLKEKIIK